MELRIVTCGLTIFDRGKIFLHCPTLVSILSAKAVSDIALLQPTAGEPPPSISMKEAYIAGCGLEIEVS